MTAEPTDPRAWLRVYLAAGPQPLSKIGRDARAVGIDAAALLVAGMAEGIASDRGRICPIWTLPTKEAQP